MAGAARTRESGRLFPVRKFARSINEGAKQERKQMKKIQTLTFAALTAMTPAALYDAAREHVKVSDAVSKARDKFTDALKPFAKIVAAMKRRYTDLREKNEIALDIPFKKFFKDNIGGELPGRAEALAALFNSLVLTLDAGGKPLLSEENFDAAAVDWLEKANAIVKSAQKQMGDDWKTCDDVLDTVNALSKPGDAAKTLRDIRKRQKGETTTDGENAVVVTPELAADYLIAAIKKAGEMPEEKSSNLYRLSLLISDAWLESGVSDETLNRWTTNIQRGIAPEMEVIEERQAVAA
jgi:hypothetical protein